jgi:ABC-2 type transport system permease protein
MSTHIVSAPTRPVKGGRHRKEPPIVFIEPNKTPETPRTPRVTYPRVLRSEWIKLVSLRSAVITLLASAGVIVGVGLLAAGMSSGTLSAPADGGPPTAADPTGITLTGTNLAQLIIGALGVMLVTSEYTSGLIRLSLAAVPTRLPVLWAKVVVLAVTSFVLLAASVVITFLGAQAMLDAGGSPTAALTDPGVLRALVGAAGYLTGIGILGIALGSLIRATAPAISILFAGVFLLPALISILLPSSWSEVTKYLPSNAGASVMTVATDPGKLDAITGAGVFAIYVIVALAGAALALRRRDV